MTIKKGRDGNMNKPSIPEKIVPEVTSNLRKNFVRVPDVIRNASGIRIFGKKEWTVTRHSSGLRNEHRSIQKSRLFLLFCIYRGWADG